MKSFVNNSLHAAILASAMLGASAFAAPVEPPDCSVAFNGDLKNVTVYACVGLDTGNFVKESADSTASAMLLDLGLVSNGAALEKGTVSGTTVTFDMLLVGYTIVGVHVGGGSDGNFKQSTAFYAFDAGAGTHVVDTRFTSLSNGGVYLTGTVTTPVPEPETYAMLVGGLALMGAVARRRRRG